MTSHPELTEFPKTPVESDIIGLANRLPRGSVTGWHAHDEAQLFHVIKGSLAVDTESGTYFVPPERAVWLPARVAHESRYLTETEFRFLYFKGSAAAELPKEPQVLQVTPFLRELIGAFMSYRRSETASGPAARIGAVVVDQLKMLPATPLQLPMPEDYRLRRVCESIVRCPAEIPNLSEASTSAAMSVRSFERRFRGETGMNYRTWCRQVKLFRALELLAGGRSVSDVSHKLGYEGPSAFVATFKKAFGVTPGRYFTE